MAGGKVTSPTGTAPERYVYYPARRSSAGYKIYDGIRETYDGPLSMATDMMTWIITRDAVTERMAVSPDSDWGVAGPGEELAPDPSRKSEYTKFVLDGRLDVDDANRAWMQAFMKEHGLTSDDLHVGE